MNTSALRLVLESAWARTLQQLEPSRLVFAAVRASMQRDPTLNLLHHPLVIASGKAAPAMAKGAIDALGSAVRGLVVTTDGTPLPALPNSVDVMRAAHPIPDERSAQAANAALDLARSSRSDAMLVLVSGGTSSLLCAPEGLSLGEKRAVTDQLLRSGANIRECNTVRRHLSGIKGGRLAAAFRGAVHCMIVSDVVGGAPHDVGSGPACADPTTIQDARNIVRQHLPGPLAARCEAAFKESVKPSSEAGGRMSVSLLAGPEQLAHTFAKQLENEGWTMNTDSLPLATGEQLSEALLLAARSLESGHGWVVACEPTLSVPRDAGRGGRAGWVALHTLLKLPEDVVLWAAASDGVDGTSGAAGACVSGSMKREVDSAVVESHLVARDDATIHEAMGTSLRGAPTGTNLTDVYAVLRAR